MTRPTRSRSSGTCARWSRRAWAPPVIGTPRSRISPRDGRADAGQRVQQLGLAVAGDPGDADDLAGADGEADALDPRHAPARPSTSRSRTSSTGSRGRAGPFSTRSSTLRPTISSASSSLLVSAVLRCATIAPARMTLTWSVTAMISRSLWVIRTMVRPCALRLRRMRNRWSASCGVSTPVGSSRISTCAPRNSALRISTRCCTPTGRLADRRVEIDLEPVVALQRRDLGPGPLGPAAEREAALGTQQQVLQHGERLDQHEMLVDHADPGR